MKFSLADQEEFLRGFCLGNLSNFFFKDDFLGIKIGMYSLATICF